MSIILKFHQNLGFQEEIPSNLYQIQRLEASLIFYSKYILNLRKFLLGKLFLSKNSSKPYFITNFLNSERSCLDQIKFNLV
jgi:hypothetical protein